jgi:hypothetical protein
MFSQFIDSVTPAQARVSVVELPDDSVAPCQRLRHADSEHAAEILVKNARTSSLPIDLLDRSLR